MTVTLPALSMVASLNGAGLSPGLPLESAIVQSPLSLRAKLTGCPELSVPVIVDNVMYVLGRENAIVALEATTGKQIWSRPVDGDGG